MSQTKIIQMAYQQVDEDHEYAEHKEPDLLGLVTNPNQNPEIRIWALSDSRHVSFPVSS